MSVSEISQQTHINFVTFQNVDGTLSQQYTIPNKVLSSINTDENQKYQIHFSKQIKNPNVMKRPRESDEEILNFFLYQFKCQPCQLKKICQDKSTCEGYHHEGEKRRNPGFGPHFLYSEEPCPKLKTAGISKWSRPSNCNDGDKCSFSHTLMEQMYHPNIYKTSLCTNFTKAGGDQCQWGYFCTHAHGQKDIRNPNNSGKQQKQKSRDNIRLENINHVVRNFPALFKNIPPVDTYNEEQTSMSQHSSVNGSPSRSYHTTLAMHSDMNTPNTKYSPLPPTYLPTELPTKPPHVMLPTTLTHQSQLLTHTITPNTMNYQPSYFPVSHTFPSRFREQTAQQFTWDTTNTSDISTMQQTQSQMQYADYQNSSPPPPITAPASYSPGSRSYVAQSYTPTSTTTSPSQKPNPLPRPRSLNVQPISIPQNKLNYSHYTPPCIVGHNSRYSSSTETCQTYTPQIASIDTQTLTNSTAYQSSKNGWKAPQSSANAFNPNPLLPLQDVASPGQQSISSQQNDEKTQSAFTGHQNAVNNNSTTQTSKETRHGMSIYLFGEDSLLSPVSNKPDGLTKTPPPPRLSVGMMNEIKRNEDTVNQLKFQIIELSKQLESEKAKNLLFSNQKKKQTDTQNMEDNEINFNKYPICPSCHTEKGTLRDRVVVPCGHLVCTQCSPSKGEFCPVCSMKTTENSQKLII